jgi:hypothetical protein
MSAVVVSCLCALVVVAGRWGRLTCCSVWRRGHRFRRKRK